MINARILLTIFPLLFTIIYLIRLKVKLSSVVAIYFFIIENPCLNLWSDKIEKEKSELVSREKVKSLLFTTYRGDIWSKYAFSYIFCEKTGILSGFLVLIHFES